MNTLMELVDKAVDRYWDSEAHTALVQGIEALQAEVDEWKQRFASADAIDTKLAAEVDRLGIARNKEAQETVAWMNECRALRAEVERLKDQLSGMDALISKIQDERDAEVDKLKGAEPVAWAKIGEKRIRLTTMDMSGSTEWVPLVKQAAPQAPAPIIGLQAVHDAVTQDPSLSDFYSKVGEWVGDTVEWTENPYKLRKGEAIYIHAKSDVRPTGETQG